jgi:hypothetical protein
MSREEKYNVMYTGESWVSTGHTVQKEWKDKPAVKTPWQAFLA